MPLAKTSMEDREYMNESPHQEDGMTKTHQEDGMTCVNENTYQGVLMTRTHQDGKAHVYEPPYQTGIVINTTHRQEMKEDERREEDGENYDCGQNKEELKNNLHVNL